MDGTDKRPGRRIATIAVAIALAVMALRLVIEVVTLIDDRAEIGRPIDPSEAWALEGTSFLAWALLLPLIWRAAAGLQPPRPSWPATLAAHLGLSIAMSLAHVAIMTMLRLAMWRLGGGTFALADDPVSDLFYEYRKDVWTYAIVAGVFATVVRVRLARPAGPSEPQSPPASLLVIDGPRRHHIPVTTIDAIEAAGNYVELMLGERRLLHRATLSALETQLGSDFARIHRSRLVRREAVRLVHTNQSGDFDVELVGGLRLKGSRRYRSALDASPEV